MNDVDKLSLTVPTPSPTPSPALPTPTTSPTPSPTTSPKTSPTTSPRPSPDNLSDAISNNLSENLSDNLSDALSDNLFDALSDNLADALSDALADTVAEWITCSITDSDSRGRFVSVSKKRPCLGVDADACHCSGVQGRGRRNSQSFFGAANLWTWALHSACEAIVIYLNRHERQGCVRTLVAVLQDLQRTKLLFIFLTFTSSARVL